MNLTNRQRANVFTFLGIALILGVIIYTLIHVPIFGVILLAIAGVICLSVASDLYAEAKKEGR